MRDVTIIVPVKDEEDGLNYLLDEFRNSTLSTDYNVKFIFIIDGRTSDNSKIIAREFSDQIIDQKDTHGKGSAIRQAIEIWRNDVTDSVIFLDADGSYSFEGVRTILAYLEDGSEVVSGSRFLNGNLVGMSRLHRFGNRMLSLISSIRNRRKISDLCTGLWGFKSDSLLCMEIRSKGFDLEAELAGLCRRNGLKHHEAPVIWSQRKGGVSKLRSITDGFIIFLRIVRT